MYIHNKRTMQTQLTNTLAFTLFLLLLVSPPRAAAARPPRDPLRSWCAKARYPTLCVQTLSNLSNPATKPLGLAQAAVKVTLSRTRILSVYVKTLKSQTATWPGLGKRQRVAVSDCVEQISDSVFQLSKTLNELQHLRAGNFQWQMSNAQTWTSAALTNGNSCLEGFNDGAAADGRLKFEVMKQKVTDVAMLTSNALYLINRFGDSVVSGKKPRTDFGN